MLKNCEVLSGSFMICSLVSCWLLFAGQDFTWLLTPDQPRGKVLFPLQIPHGSSLRAEQTAPCLSVAASPFLCCYVNPCLIVPFYPTHLGSSKS
ncbi:hypothetical protein Cni_G13539 [Canna indica]|uniref:Uncharacterized protein n=1 Tax=Canna indica TaxID=4628 RepID=A0AAQ3KE91_9LILI|nr:hypothetical protein Cni_G13539 [Canna indica]